MLMYEIAVMYEIADIPSKSDTDHIALISWNGFHKTKYRSHKKTESQLTKMEIHI
jgi:hypothetical protein